jgi:hypothetical protein
MKKSKPNDSKSRDTYRKVLDHRNVLPPSEDWGVGRLREEGVEGFNRALDAVWLMLNFQFTLSDAAHTSQRTRTTPTAGSPLEA